MNSTDFYNVSLNEFGKPVLTTTYTQLFQSMQMGFINILFFISIFFLVLTFSVLEFNKKNAPSWGEVIDGTLKWDNPKRSKILLLRTCAWICLPLSLFFFFLMISVKFNLNW